MAQMNDPEGAEFFARFVVDELGPTALAHGKMSIFEAAERAFYAGRASRNGFTTRGRAFPIITQEGDRATIWLVTRGDDGTLVPVEGAFFVHAPASWMKHIKPRMDD